MTEKDKQEREVVATNRRARHDYEILETYEAGIALEGPEVKSLRLKQAQIAQSFARVEPGGLYLHGMHIAPYAFNTATKPDPLRVRRLLLNRSEIRKLARAVSVKGHALIALEIYFRNGWAKALLGLARGKRGRDKHEALKKREQDRELRRDFKEKFKG